MAQELEVANKQSRVRAGGALTGSKCPQLMRAWLKISMLNTSYQQPSIHRDKASMSDLEKQCPSRGILDIYIYICTVDMSLVICKELLLKHEWK